MAYLKDEFEDDQPFFDPEREDVAPLSDEEAIMGGVSSSFSAAGETSFDAEASPTPARLLPGRFIRPLTSPPTPPLPRRVASPYFSVLRGSDVPSSPGTDLTDAPMQNESGSYQDDEADDKLWAGLADLDVPETADGITNLASAYNDAQADEPTVTPEVLKRRQEMLKKGLTTNGVSLVPITRFKTKQHRKLFDFATFNNMQSQVFEDVYEGDDNLVISAPTGSGKTTIFELAFLRTLLMYEQKDHQRLCVYIAPTKALCSEKAKDWGDRMTELKDANEKSINCVAITGDSGTSADLYYKLKNAHLVVTTPEKFDSITRRSGKSTRELHDRLVLIMIDEGNRNDELGETPRVLRGDGNAEGEGIQVPLQRETYGIDGGGNEWQLGPKLDRELYPILVRHAKGKPVLVFCPTRSLFEAYEQSASKGLRLPWTFDPKNKIVLTDPKDPKASTDPEAEQFASRGIALHHAGLEYRVRRIIEEGFKSGHLMMIVSTSTLAVGVNLPAHTVIIKGTMTWHGASTGFREYSDIEIQQMVGRAGRPQYDTTGTVIIMCDRSKVQKYQSMLRCETILESCLHRNLTEHLNSEIGLGTIRSVSGAQQWLRRYYALPDALNKPQGDSWEDWLNHYVKQSLERLDQDGFLERGEDGNMPGDYEVQQSCTGDIMSTCMIAYGTMCMIVEMDPKSTFDDLLGILAGAQEFSDLRMRPGEAKLRQHPEIRYHLNDQAKTYADKVFLLLQYTFGNVTIQEDNRTENASIKQTLYQVFSRASRIAKGPKTIKNLGALGIKTFDQFLFADSTQLQPVFKSYNMVTDRKKEVRHLPQFMATIEEEKLDSSNPRKPVLVLRVTLLPKRKKEELQEMNFQASKKRSSWRTQYNVSALFLRQKDVFIDYRRKLVKDLQKKKETSFLVRVDLDRRCDVVTAIVAVDEIAGSASVIEYPTNLADSVYPPDVKDDTPTPPASQDVTIDDGEAAAGKSNVPCHHTCSGTDNCAHKCCKEGVPPKPHTRTLTKQAIATARLPLRTTPRVVQATKSTVEAKRAATDTVIDCREENDAIDCTNAVPKKRLKRKQSSSIIETVVESIKPGRAKSPFNAQTPPPSLTSIDAGRQSRKADPSTKTKHADQDEYEMIPIESSDDEERPGLTQAQDINSPGNDSVIATDAHTVINNINSPEHSDSRIDTVSQADPNKLPTDPVTDDWDEDNLFKDVRILPSSLPSLISSQSNSQMTLLGTPATQHSQSNIAYHGSDIWNQVSDQDRAAGNFVSDSQPRAVKRARFSSASPEVNTYIPERPYYSPEAQYRDSGYPSAFRPLGDTYQNRADNRADPQIPHDSRQRYTPAQGSSGSQAQSQAFLGPARPFLSADSLGNRASLRNTQELDEDDKELLDFFDGPDMRIID
ncbi:hypothetical protein IAU59_006802 [Kwoniella sp. CBS 9459]